jgi:hypothetical protein
VDALIWAFDQAADVVNDTYMACAGGVPTAQDQAFDYYARTRNRLIVVSSGNNTNPNCLQDFVKAPAMAWNVISVGASDNGDDANWANDVIAFCSAWDNPTSLHGDHEKPEVVAPGVSVVGVIQNGNLQGPGQCGTSSSAPQVAGLAALLIHRKSTLRFWPEANKAIIMASAINNVDGPNEIPSYQDLKDGAGGIDAALADNAASLGTTNINSAAPCNQPCWWGLAINNTNFPINTYLYRSFKAVRGERIRVAISWLSNSDCSHTITACTFDRLDTDLNLSVFAPDGSLVIGAYSASWDNNYELVDFTAPQTGQYNIGIYKERADEISNYLGIAWIKDATYLPDLRNDANGWTSQIYANYARWAAAPGSGSITITCFDANGNFVNSTSFTMAANGSGWSSMTISGCLSIGATGSAVVNAGEGVIVEVENHNTSAGEASNYTGILSSGQSGNGEWGQVGTMLYAPDVKANANGRTTDLYIMNTSSTSTNVQVNYYLDNGSLYASSTCNNLARLARCIVTPPLSGPSPGPLNALITASQPLAAIAVERPHDATGQAGANASNLLIGGATTLYVPSVKQGFNGQSTNLRIRNIGQSVNSVSVIYYDSTSSTTYTAGPYLVQVNGAVPVLASSILPNGFYGSARIVSNNLQPIVAQVNEEGSFRMSSSASQQPSSKLSYAVACNGCVGVGVFFKSNIRVQNTNSAPSDVRIRFYDSSGVQFGSIQLISKLGGYKAQNVIIPSGLQGSSVITATQPIVVIVDINDNQLPEDWRVTYNAPNR